MAKDPTTVQLSYQSSISRKAISPLISLTLVAPAVAAGICWLTMNHRLSLSDNNEIYASAWGVLISTIVGIASIVYCWKFRKDSWTLLVMTVHVLSVLSGFLLLALIAIMFLS